MVGMEYLLVLPLSSLQLHNNYSHSLVRDADGLEEEGRDGWLAVLESGAYKEGGRVGWVVVDAWEEGGRAGLVALALEGGMDGLMWSCTPHLQGWEGRQCISSVSPETDVGYLVIFGCLSVLTFFGSKNFLMPHSILLTGEHLV